MGRPYVLTTHLQTYLRSFPRLVTSASVKEGLVSHFESSRVQALFPIKETPLLSNGMEQEDGWCLPDPLSDLSRSGSTGVVFVDLQGA